MRHFHEGIVAAIFRAGGGFVHGPIEIARVKMK